MCTVLALLQCPTQAYPGMADPTALRSLARQVSDMALHVGTVDDTEGLAELSSLTNAVQALQLAIATGSSHLLRLSDELVVLILRECTPSALACLATTCSTLRPKARRAVHGVALRTFDDSLHGRYAAEYLRSRPEIRVLQSLEAARDVAERADRGAVYNGNGGDPIVDPTMALPAPCR